MSALIQVVEVKDGYWYLPCTHVVAAGRRICHRCVELGDRTSPEALIEAPDEKAKEGT